VIVAEFIDMLKVAVRAEFTATPVAPLAGAIEVTVGAVGGGGGVDVPELDPPHPETKSAADTSKQAIPKRMINFSLIYHWYLPLAERMASSTCSREKVHESFLCANFVRQRTGVPASPCFTKHN
jgi:hypothetical protein